MPKKMPRDAKDPNNLVTARIVYSMVGSSFPTLAGSHRKDPSKRGWMRVKVGTSSITRLHQRTEELRGERTPLHLGRGYGGYIITDRRFDLNADFHQKGRQHNAPHIKLVPGGALPDPELGSRYRNWSTHPSAHLHIFAWSSRDDAEAIEGFVHRRLEAAGNIVRDRAHSQGSKIIRCHELADTPEERLADILADARREFSRLIMSPPFPMTIID